MAEHPGAGGRRPAKRGAFPPTRKSLGQHFLGDKRILTRIADALELTGTETVVEIGPGRGSLTDLLVERAGRVVAIEYDRALAELLRKRYAADAKVTVVEADVLTVSLGDAAGGEFVLVGNVPYYITTPILFHALERPRPSRAVYLVQREVADRIVASPGSRDYGALSVNIQAVATAELLFKVPAGAFRPPPKVESAVVRITPRPDPVVKPEDEERYRRFVQDCFSMRRKQMQRILRSLTSRPADEVETLLLGAGVDPEARPETLTPLAFAVLSEVCSPK